MADSTKQPRPGKRDKETPSRTSHGILHRISGDDEEPDADVFAAGDEAGLEDANAGGGEPDLSDG